MAGGSSVSRVKGVDVTVVVADVCRPVRIHDR
jgi:hypothetical protein